MREDTFLEQVSFQCSNLFLLLWVSYFAAKFVANWSKTNLALLLAVLSRRRDRSDGIRDAQTEWPINLRVRGILDWPPDQCCTLPAAFRVGRRWRRRTRGQWRMHTPIWGSPRSTASVESSRFRDVHSGIAGKMATEDIDRAKVLQEFSRSWFPDATDAVSSNDRDSRPSPVILQSSPSKCILGWISAFKTLPYLEMTNTSLLVYYKCFLFLLSLFFCCKASFTLFYMCASTIEYLNLWSYVSYPRVLALRRHNCTLN